jgi:very-short-patch-repair endonuclease
MSATDKAFKNVRRLRRELSLPEKLLWVRLKGTGGHFRKQHPVGDYVLDFYCASANLAVEVDGFAHDTGNRPQRDETRTAWLNANGIEVLRVPAKDVLADPDAVADAVLRLVEKPLHHSASPSGPPPHASGAGRSE